ENRYYFHKERNISISYIAYMGEGYGPKIHGWWNPLTNETNHQFHPPTETFVPYEWGADSVQTALSDFVVKLRSKPSVLILNAGIWPNFYNKEGHRHSVLNLAMSLFDRVIWKATHYDRNHVRKPTYGICEHPGIECLNLDWTEHLQFEDYTDMLHFQSRIYTDIDIQLILQLTHRSNASTVYVPMNTNLRGSIVRHQDKHYLVDEKGLLRPFTLPVKNIAYEACFKKLSSRVKVERSASFLQTHLLGPAIPNICAV
ncbi:MAG: hypothetical protein B7Z16_18915, partial [Algoriphagus sp. 32-45-6]